MVQTTVTLELKLFSNILYFIEISPKKKKTIDFNRQKGYAQMEVTHPKSPYILVVLRKKAQK